MPSDESNQPASENIGKYKAVYSSTRDAQGGIPQIVIQQPANSSGWSWIMTRVLGAVLVFSLILNMSLMTQQSALMGDISGPIEKFHNGDKSATNKIAIIRIETTIMPPYTEKVFDVIKKIDEDDSVKGVILAIDSPGGLVADSHEIYHKLQALAQKKPMYVSMRRLAASGGYYVAMGIGEKGKIYAEPTTWTGSIGVIIPRYDVSELAKNWGVKADPLTTGPFKDALSPFKPLSEAEREVWSGIMDESYQRFVDIIDANRPNMNREQVLEVATGRIFTSQQAVDKGLVDKIGFLDDAIDAMKTDHNLGAIKVVKYEFTPTLSSLIFGEAKLEATPNVMETLMNQSVPRAMYLFSWQTSER